MWLQSRGASGYSVTPHGGSVALILYQWLYVQCQSTEYTKIEGTAPCIWCCTVMIAYNLAETETRLRSVRAFIQL